MSDMNKRIAEALRWRDIKFVTRDGNIEWYGIPPASHYDVLLPDFEHDLNAALSLVADLPGFSLNRCNLAEWGAKWEASIPTGTDGDPYYITAYHDDPARAICRAYRKLVERE